MKTCVLIYAIGGKSWAIDSKTDEETLFITTIKHTIASLYGLTKQTYEMRYLTYDFDSGTYHGEWKNAHVDIRITFDINFL